MKRDAPIPWSVSLPFVGALVALIVGWRHLAAPPAPPSALSETPAVVASPITAPPAAPVAAPVTAVPPPAAAAKGSAAPAPSESAVSPKPVAVDPPSSPQPAPDAPAPSAPAASPASPASPDSPTPPAPPAVRAATRPTMAPESAGDRLATLPAEALPASLDAANRRTLQKLRDHLGARAADFGVEALAAARVVVVAASERRPADLSATLAGLAERLQARLLAPAHLDAARRPWLVLFVGDAEDAIDFDGVVWSGGAAPLAELARRQLAGLLQRGPEHVVVEWALLGAAGYVAAATPDATLPPPIVPLATLFVGSSGDEPEAWRAAATSFATFCLERGARDPRATGFLELLRTDGRTLPTAAEARVAEIAARLGVTRVEELEAEWAAARH